MTLTEYQRKLSLLMSSDAPLKDKDEAIAKLRAQFNPTDSVQVAIQQFEESKSDTSDIGSSND